MSDLHFTERDTWGDGYYELAMEIGDRSDTLLLKALQRLWTHPSLEGGYENRDVEPSEQERVTPTSEHLEWGQGLLGIAHLPDGNRIVCSGHVLRYDDGTDWLILGIPRPALNFTYFRGHGADESKIDLKEYDKSIVKWRNVLDPWLMEIGQYVYQTVPFRLGVIGLEPAADTTAAELAVQGIPPYEQRNIAYLWPETGQLEHHPYSAELKYYPYAADSGNTTWVEILQLVVIVILLIPAAPFIGLWLLIERLRRSRAV